MSAKILQFPQPKPEFDLFAAEVKIVKEALEQTVVFRSFEELAEQAVQALWDSGYCIVESNIFELDDPA
jgi:hypothetical protein